MPEKSLLSLAQQKLKTFPQQVTPLIQKPFHPTKTKAAVCSTLNVLSDDQSQETITHETMSHPQQ